MKKVKESKAAMTLVIVQCLPSIKLITCFLFLFVFISSCTVSKQMINQAGKTLLKDSAVSTGHLGISIYEPAAGKYWYNYNDIKYFIPASNTKLFTLYAGMKYLGDSLTGLAYQNFSDTAINVSGTGDPTFLHPDFKNQPVLDFLKKERRVIYLSGIYKDSALGYGWAWDDYNDDYMVERNAFPVYGNIIKVGLNGYKDTRQNMSYPDWKITPTFFSNAIDSQFVIDYFTSIKDTNIVKQKTQSFTIRRERNSNRLHLQEGSTLFKSTEIPFMTNGVKTSFQILKNDFHLNIIHGIIVDNNADPNLPDYRRWHKIKTQPTDSLFKPMMHRSDNFFAEQTLLMVSNEYLGYMGTGNIIENLLNTDLKDIGQRPKWVDGSGLSRYNLFTPRNFIYILNKMNTEFGLERVKGILPTGGTGTLSSYFKKDSGFIYAKTGTLSNNTALSGFLITKKGKILIFSVLANNYITSGVLVKKAIEQFLLAIRENY